jgi:hypothetical protein
VSEIESIDGEMEILCVRKTHRAPAALVQRADLNLQLVMIDPRRRRSEAADSEHYARDILADPIAMFFVRT